MGGVSSWDRLQRRFRQDRSGNFTVVAGVAMSVLALAVGYGVNVAQVYNVRTNLVASLDAALTSAGRDISTGVIKENEAAKTIKAFLLANGDPSVNNGDNKIMLVEPVTINRTAKTITATAFVDVDAFLPLFGQSNRTRVTTTAATIYSNVQVEVAMMLDVTGSMGWQGTSFNGRPQTKLQNLQAAAKNAVDNLLSRNQPGIDPRVRVAIIPYSQSVNSGPLSDANYAEYDLTEEKGKKSKGLLSSIVGGLVDSLQGLFAEQGISEVDSVTQGMKRPIGLTDLDKAVNKTLKKILQATRKAKDDTCTTERKKIDATGQVLFDPSDDPPTVAMVNRDKRLGSDAGKKTACPSAPILPLTADASDLKDSIDSLTANGGTAGHIGIQWTRYLLSPAWGDFIKSHVDGAAPAQYGGGVRKVAILLTDGEFNAAYAGVPTTEDTSRTQETRSGDYAKVLCKTMKDDGVEVFTIGFMLDAGKETLKTCASSDTSKVKHFYDASNAEELNAAFEAITQNYEVLRLTQ